MYLASFLDAIDISHEQKVLTRLQVYQRMVEKICHRHKLPVSCRELMDMVLRRDEEAPTAYATGIAIPHIRMDGFEDTVIGMTFLQNPIDFDGTMVSWVVLIITDKTSSNVYLNIVAALLKLSKDEQALSLLRSAPDGHAVIQHLKKMNVEIKKDVCIADIMITNPISIGPEATLRELNNLMSLHQVAGLPVVDAHGKYLGEVHILNVLKVGIPEYMMMLDNLNFLMSFEPLEKLFDKQDEVLVREIMVMDGVFLRPEASIIEAVFEMINHHKRYMSVVKDGNLVGLVTAMDVLRKVITA
jgi:PTS system nitrogen regulatory IIA component